MKRKPKKRKAWNVEVILPKKWGRVKPLTTSSMATVASLISVIIGMPRETVLKCLSISPARSPNTRTSPRKKR